MKFELGSGGKCDLEKLVDTRLLIQANSGGGKSWCLRRVLEQTHGHVQHLVIDPEGEFVSLREKFDYVYAAKQSGDTAADPRSAKLLAERLLELRVSAILDIYELKAHQRIDFVRYFLEALVDAKKELWHPVIVVLDEAHVYCPQKGEAESLGAVIDLCTRGRKRGFCAVLATQRLSKLHKDAAAELNNKLIGRTGLDVDRLRAAEELGFTTKEQNHALRDLKPGTFYAFGPALASGVTQVSIGPVQTTHPEAGSRITFTPPAPTAAVKALLPKLADLPAEAEQRQKSVDDLRKDNAELRRQLTMAQRAQPQKTETKVVQSRVEVPVVPASDMRRIETAAKAAQAASAKVQAATEAVLTRMRVIAGQAAPKVVTTPQRIQRIAAPVKRREPPSDGTLSGPEQRILDAIAWCESIGITEPEQTAVAFLAGYTYGGGAFNNPKGSLNSRDLVRYVGSHAIALTDEGRSLASPPDSALTTEQLHSLVLARLPGPERKILSVLLEVWPERLEKSDLAQRAGYALGGAFNNPLGRLRSLGLVDYPERGNARARDLLFLETV
jgi:hypothetical protein